MSGIQPGKCQPFPTWPPNAPSMAHVGGNGANGSGNVKNGGFNFVLNVIGARQGGPTEVNGDDLWNDNVAPVDQLGLNNPPPQNRRDPVENGVSRRNTPYNPQSVQNTPVTRTTTPDQLNRASNRFLGFSMGPDRNKVIEQAKRAMDELVKLATTGQPMWQRNGEIETLNGLQYLREFGCADATMEDIMKLVEVGQPRQLPSFNGTDTYFPRDIPTPLSLTLGSEPLHVEASRDVGFVKMNFMNIVKLFMDWNQWLMAFPSIVSRATLQEVLLSNADGSYNGVLQVMTAEFHQNTPLVPARQSYFARYCKMITNGTWAVVDVCLENLLPYPQQQFRRRPSGCLIEQMPSNGSYSKITWVEHVEADHASLHTLFRTIVASGFAFGARRWIAALDRHCQGLATSMATITPVDSGVLILPPGKEGVLRMAERMMRKFFMNVSPCPQNSWMRLPSNFGGAEDVRIRFGNVLDIPGRPLTNTLIFTTTFRMPVRMRMMFEFLRDVRSRIYWDFLLRGQLLRDVAHLRTGENPENRISIIQVNSSVNRFRIFYLQESYYDETGSYVVYEPVNLCDLSYVLSGGNPDVPFVLPSGIAILPEKRPGLGDGPVGSVLTMAFHIDTSSTDQLIPPTALNTIHTFLGKTVSSIREIFR
ncbi:hypothetical protein V6N13_085104 [Hibiscus sabdariffa]|uniref:START domain-containing protein n=1 Tax=Hibiscus sabdariffa TaxID=183260 RepID=A0ABR2D0I4_9ROSI